MCQHLYVWDNQVIGYWRDEKETWETTKALEKEVGDGHGLQYVSLEVPKQVWGRGQEKGGGGSLVNTALLLILPLPHPLWAGPDQCKSHTQHPSLQNGQLTCVACILGVSQSSETVWVHGITSSAIQAEGLRAAWHGSEKEDSLLQKHLVQLHGIVPSPDFIYFLLHSCSQATSEKIIRSHNSYHFRNALSNLEVMSDHFNTPPQIYYSYNILLIFNASTFLLI